MAVSFLKLSDTLEFISIDGAANAAYVCRRTGEIYWDSSLADDEEELPDDIEDETKYLAVPNKRDLDLGKPLALDFAKAFLPDDVFNVHEIFDRRGAFQKFHSLLRLRGQTERWYTFEAEATERALRDWCAANKIELVE
jgi:hypothetical protein